MRYVAPAGAPIRLRDIARALAGLRGDPRERLAQSVRNRFGVECVPVCTGRAGLTLLLRALRHVANGDRDEVVLPSYTCYSVAASTVRAGLKVRIVDVDPATLDYDHDRLRRSDLRRTLAIVATNLYGLPNDMPRLSTIAREHGAFLLDDAAQAMGARIGGRWSGTHGDAGLFSLDKGKNISAVDGGLMLTGRPDVAAALQREIAPLSAPRSGDVAMLHARLAVYALLLHPSAYWLPNAIPQLGLGQTIYTTDFAVETCCPSAASLGETMLGRLDAFTDARRANAARLSELLADAPGVTPVRPASGATAVYVRLPVLVSDTEMRERLRRGLNASGVGATGSYPGSIADIPALRPHLADPEPVASGGRDVAARILTLPTHPFVSVGDCRHMAAVIERIVRPAAVATEHPQVV